MALAAVASAVVLAACSGGGDRAGRFCAEVRAEQTTIATAVQDAGQVGGVVDRFRALERTAPLAIEEDWGVLTELVASAAAIEPGDDEARARLVSAAYEADGSVRNIIGWVRSVCGVDLTVAPTTTAAPTSSS